MQTGVRPLTQLSERFRVNLRRRKTTRPIDRYPGGEVAGRGENVSAETARGARGRGLGYGSSAKARWRKDSGASDAAQAAAAAGLAEPQRWTKLMTASSCAGPESMD